MARHPGVFVRDLSMQDGQKLQRVTRTAKDPVNLRRTISNVANGTFRGNLAIESKGKQVIPAWQARFELAPGQVLQQPTTGAFFSQSGPNSMNKTVNNGFSNGVILPGQTISGISFTASWDNFVNQKPPNISLNGKWCAVP